MAATHFIMCVFLQDTARC